MINVGIISDILSQRSLAAWVRKWKLEPVPGSVHNVLALRAVLLSSWEQNYSTFWGAKIIVKNVSFYGIHTFCNWSGGFHIDNRPTVPPGTVDSQFWGHRQGQEEVDSPTHHSGGRPSAGSDMGFGSWKRKGNSSEAEQPPKALSLLLPSTSRCHQRPGLQPGGRWLPLTALTCPRQC